MPCRNRTKNLALTDAEKRAETLRFACYAKETTCLHCRGRFKSQDIRKNRICKPCYSSQGFQSASSVTPFGTYGMY